MIHSVAIITHELDAELRGGPFLLSNLIDAWEEQGIEVHITEGCHYIPADIAVMHIDTTRISEEYQALAQRYDYVINGRITDISKSSFSQQLLKEKDDYEGRVIIKTDANFGGIPELDFIRREGSEINNGQALSWENLRYIDSSKYPVYASIKEVPEGVWQNPHLIVEKYLAESLDSGDYKLRTYLFFGNEEIAMWHISPDLINKLDNTTSRGFLEEVPEVLREFRAGSGFDMGRFDYTEVDGEVVLLDINKTPGVGPLVREIIRGPMKAHFARAVHVFSTDNSKQS